MTDYDKLVEALRLCQFGECGCGKCYYKELKGDWCTEDNHPEFFDCDDKLKLDAADAIDALQRELNLAEIAADDNGRQVEELLAQLPKRGKWIHNVAVQGTTAGGVTFYHGYTCSVCGALMGRKGDAYCYKCGAKMEVQE